MSHNRLEVITALSLLLLFWNSVTAYAQDASSGSLLQDLEQKTIPSPLQPDNQRKNPPEAEVEDSRRAEPQEQQEEPSEKKLFIKEIQLQNSTLLNNKELESIISPYEERENSFNDLQALVSELTNLYIKKGFVTSRVYIPPQKLKDGILILQTTEGEVGKVDIKEGRYFKARSVKYFVEPDPEDYFNLNRLKQSLRQLNENPDINVKAALQPGEKAGDTDIEFKIEDKFPVHAVPYFDNLGRNLIGENRGGIRAYHNNLLGFGDTAVSALSFTKRSTGIVSSYELPINRHGTKIGFDHAISNLELGKEFKDLDVKGYASIYCPFISQDLINRDNYKVSIGMDLDFKQLDTDAQGTDFSHDLLRVLKPALTIEAFDKWGKTFLQHEIGLGLDIFGATDGFEGSPSREGAGGKFFNYKGSLIRLQKLPLSSYGILKITGQLSPDRLVSSEQFQIGGAFDVRGYREGLVSGDKGILISGEWRMPLFLIPKSGWKLPGTNYVLSRDDIQLAPFVDYGSATVNKPAAGVDKREHLLAAGAGLRVRLTRFITARLDIGFPLLKQPSSSTARVHFSLQSALF